MAQFIIPATLLQAIVKAAASHAKSRDGCSVMAGVLIETDDATQEIRFVSTDGYRLYERAVGRSELVSGSFPNYRQIIPDTFRHEVTIDRKALQAALKAMPGVPKDGNAITITANGHVEINGSDKAGNRLSQTLPAIESRHDADPEVTVTFNASYLADALAAMDSSQTGSERKSRNKSLADNIRLRLNSPVNAAMVVADTLGIEWLNSEAGRSLVMPIRA